MHALDLREWLGSDAEGYCAELAMDLAVSQLESAGLIKSTSLPDLLSDGTPDYLVELTPLGEVFVEELRTFKFTGAML
jgi:hypothetical protein